MSTDTVIVPAESLPDVAADWIAEAVIGAVEARDRAAIALAGGSTPRPVYERLATRRLPWPRIHVYFGDERAVPPDDPAANYRMVRETLLARVAVPTGQVHRMEAERPDREEAAREYESLLPDPLDIVVLGIGADGHTASLFPGAPAVRERVRKVVAVEGPKPPRARLTVTPKVIEEARRVLVIAEGERKAAAVARALEGDYAPTSCPVQVAREAMWILDTAAAEALAGTAPS